ncbi:MAG: hypothetical protein H8E55_59360 [Pelagibacterales bacterium]|nr:hypothetical protein [Pelagibacterales bacterium]
MNKNEKHKESRRKYYLKNRESELEKHKLYVNTEKGREKLEAYHKTPEYKKCYRICSWKRTGVIHDDFDSLYDYYLNTNNCELCNIELITGNYGNNKKTLDHDHDTGLFRYVLCNTCNSHKTANRHTPQTKEERAELKRIYQKNQSQTKKKEYGANRRFRDKLRDFIYS